MLDFILLETTKNIDPILVDKLLKTLFSHLVDLGSRIVIAVMVYFVGIWLISLLRKVVKKILVKRKTQNTVASFINSATNIALKVALAIIIIGILGISTTSFAAILGAAGLAIGMSMKDNLSNFAGGVMILLNKPFVLNDHIVAQGQDGIVQEIGILYTILLTGDGKTIFMPNGPLSTGCITNYSTQVNRRVDLSININYGNNADELSKIMAEIVDSIPEILKSPTPFIGITTINNGNFDITIRAWGINSDYSKISISLNEAIYRVLTNKGIFVSSSLTVKMT